MFDKKMFGQMRKSGMGIGLSKSKLSEAMLEILLQLPEGTINLKDTIVANMGIMGYMSATRDINAAWNQTKTKAAKLYPEKFILDGRKVLHWNDGAVKVLDKSISLANFKKLNEIADRENCNVNQVITRLVKSYKK